MEKNAWSMPELKDSEALVEDPAPTKELTRSKSAKQFTWVLLLRVNKLVGFMAWVGSGVATLFSHVRRRLLTKEGLEHGVGGPGETKPTGRLLRVLRLMLIISVLMLVFEVFTHWQGWHSFGPHIRIPETSGLHSFLHWFYLSWVYVRKKYIGPPLQYSANACIWLFMLQSIDRFILFLGCIWINLRGYKPKPMSNIDEANPEDPGDDFPMVLVQIPMCNEREVFDQSIGAACQLDWPKNRMLVQVLDDSDDEEIQMMIRGEVQKWLQKGSPITYRHRLIRKGYKAGNLKSAMSCDYVKDYEYVAIFDADFQPRPDFLKRTIPHFKGQPEVGLVQARWAFVNKDENLLTRLQHINLSYHFEVEQQVNGAFINFFGFNGTAGVWRISALEESGGWLDRTTVEDMDIAVRAHLKGWKFIFLNDVEALCELPESYEAYRKQQHRWHSGPMQLFRLCLPDIISAKLELWKKINMVFLFFLLRKMILPFYSFTLFCIILPITMFIPEASLPLWVVCYVPALMSIMNVVPSPKSFPFIVPYLLFENTMSVTKFNAMVAGLFQLHSSYEWVVTKKTGRASEADLLAMVRQDSAAFEISALPNRTSSEVNLESKATNPAEKVEEDGTVIIDQKTVALAPTTPHAETPRVKEKKPPREQKMYRKELALAMLLLVAAARSLLTEHGMHFYFLLFQGLAFLVVGLDLISDSPV